MQPEITSEIAPPVPRGRRLSPELKSIQPGQSVLLDGPTASCLLVYLRYHGHSATQRKEGDRVRVWRLA